LLPFVVNAAGGVLAVLLGGALVASMIVLSIAPRERKQISAEKNPNPHLNTHVQRAYFFANASKAIKRLTPASTLLLLLDFSSGIFYGVVWFVIPLIIASALYNGVLLSAGLAAIDFTTIIVGSYLSRLTKSNTLKGLIFAGLVLFSASGFLLGTSFGAVFILFAILSSTGDEMASLPLWVWLHQLDKKHNQDGLISGILELGSELGWALGPLTAGILYTIVGPSWAIALGAIPVAVVLCIYYFSVRKHVIKMSLFIVPPRPHRARHKS
jgi:MFS family permease